jgi:RNA polymerase sigma-70 factor (ECF subfamily)
LPTGEVLGNPERERGRFRSYLLGAMKHFLANRAREAGREKRGAGAEHVALDAEIAEGSTLAPEATFDREWALAIVERGLAALREECESAGQGAHFATLSPWLTPSATTSAHADADAQLGSNEGAVKVAIHRLRRRFRTIVREEIARTLHDPAKLAGEMRHLVAALGAQ